MIVETFVKAVYEFKCETISMDVLVMMLDTNITMQNLLKIALVSIAKDGVQPPS